MIRIGLVGEDPNDTKAIKHLLEPAFAKHVQFFPMLKQQKGDDLGNKKTARMLAIELQDKQPDIVVFIRDADGIRTEKGQLDNRHIWYQKLAAMVQGKTLLLLNIYALEALILADIDTFSKIYNVDIKYGGDVAMQAKPFNWLRDRTKDSKKFEKSHCPEIFKALDLVTVRKRCNYFDTFFKELEGFVGN